jgi:hypothetical protein
MPPTIDPQSADFANAVNLLAVFSEATTRLAALKSDADAALLDIIDERRKEYADLQKSLTESEAALTELAHAHPEWFASDKTVKTPFGSVHSHKSTSHEAPDAVSAIARIKAAQARAIKAGNDVRATQLAALIRTEEKLNLDALGEMTVEEIASFGIVRKIEESVTVKPASIALGQAVKAADKRAARKAKEIPA